MSLLVSSNDSHFLNTLWWCVHIIILLLVLVQHAVHCALHIPPPIVPFSNQVTLVVGEHHRIRLLANSLLCRVFNVQMCSSLCRSDSFLYCFSVCQSSSNVYCLSVSIYIYLHTLYIFHLYLLIHILHFLVLRLFFFFFAPTSPTSLLLELIFRLRIKFCITIKI